MLYILVHLTLHLPIFQLGEDQNFFPYSTVCNTFCIQIRFAGLTIHDHRTDGLKFYRINDLLTHKSQMDGLYIQQA